MKYSCYTLDNATWKLKRTDFLTDAATAFLDEVESDVFKEWKGSFPTHKSLSSVVNSTIVDSLERSTDTIDANKITHFRTIRAFNNRKYSGDTCLSIFREFKASAGAEIVVYIACEAFKKKFRFDGTYMSIEQFPDYYADFVQTMEPQKVPMIHFIAFDDLAFETDVLVRGKQKFVKLIETN